MLRRGSTAAAAGRVIALALCALTAMAGVASADEPTSTDPATDPAAADPAVVNPVDSDPAAAASARERTTAWIVPWDRTNVLASLRDHASSVGRISPFWFVLRADGRGIVARSGSMDPEVLGIAEVEGMTVLPTVGNEFDARRLSRVLATPASRTRHVAQLVALASRPQFAGVDLDYENIAPRDRVRFAALVHEAAARLHERGLELSVTVGASTKFMGSTYDRGTDYATIGADADEVRVMAYDYHWSCGRPGPTAPVDWVVRVVDYVGALVPADKLALGLPLYGYDWPVHGCATARTWAQTQALLRGRAVARVSWSPQWATRHLSYGFGRRARVSWFEDAESTAAKAHVAEEYGLRGVALWRTGGEDPATWDALEQELGQVAPPDPGPEA
ncbi:MAG: ydhD [Thermoleophilia bacterium]|nr:ydhD [Thermoleophilia bacterium]